MKSQIGVINGQINQLAAQVHDTDSCLLTLQVSHGMLRICSSYSLSVSDHVLTLVMPALPHMLQISYKPSYLGACLSICSTLCTFRLSCQPPGYKRSKQQFERHDAPWMCLWYNSYTQDTFV